MSATGAFPSSDHSNHSSSSRQRLLQQMEYQKWMEDKENEARQEIIDTHHKVMDGSLKSKISSCSQDNNDGNTEEERMDPMLLKEREAANFLAQHADMVRNGTWKKMKQEQERKKKQQQQEEEEERKRKEEALLWKDKGPIEQETTTTKAHQENNSTKQEPPSRRKILRFLCCTVVEESY
ncbi:hypothetical protein GAYE_SCF45G5745 [Galdieria yellowstonensis]|uniref:Uncharacterized protein n=1 Tax=Galdieria yellowstonensis TaxID=3028027 RepID=A0AAV9IKJ5_9RHOD|nr:hypothetical protein GAYE_SCF45G5745 [Galdieria yellowstonensis]